MENSPTTFIIIGIVVLVAALVLGRMLRKPLNRQMPGSDRDGARPQAWWIGGPGGRDRGGGGDE
jgi:hypothetical protein